MPAHDDNDAIHVTSTEKSAWNNKASQADLAAIQADADDALKKAEAAQAAVDSEVTARQSAISAESSARQTAISALQTELAKCGKFKIVTGSYTGNGTYGSANKRTLTFSVAPLLLIVAGSNAMFAVHGNAYGPTSNGNYVETSWSGTSVSWYRDNAFAHMNQNGTTYYYIALLPTE